MNKLFLAIICLLSFNLFTMDKIGKEYQSKKYFFHCDICNQNLLGKYSGALEQDRAYHYEKKHYICPECQTQYPSSIEVKEHRGQEHDALTLSPISFRALLERL